LIDSGNTHRLIASRQSKAYLSDKSELAHDTIMIEIEWKQKVLIGKYFCSYESNYFYVIILKEV